MQTLKVHNVLLRSDYFISIYYLFLSSNQLLNFSFFDAPSHLYNLHSLFRFLKIFV